MSKHAYLIMAHADRFLLETLIGMLDDERNDIFLHIDKKWTAFDSAWFVTTQAQLYILEKRFDARWGHSSLIDVEYALFEAAYNQRGTKYEYYHLLSGADLPIKSQDYIHDFFNKNRGVEFISYWLTSDHLSDAEYKISRYHFFMEYEKFNYRIPSIIFAKLRFLLAKLFPLRALEMDYVKGSQWLSLTTQAIQYLIESKYFVQKRARYTRAIDEIIIQSLLWHNKDVDLYNIDGEYLHSSLREIRWVSGAISPETYTIRDKDFLLSSEMLFARKFNSNVDQEIIKFIAEQFSSSKVD